MLETHAPMTSQFVCFIIIKKVKNKKKKNKGWSLHQVFAQNTCIMSIQDGGM